MPAEKVDRGSGQATILVIDDEPRNLLLLGQVLSPHFRVLVADSAARGLELAEQTPRPDLILLDIMMPVMDGYAVLSVLRNNALTQDLPVIFVTALSSVDDEAEGLRLGAQDYISKPINPPIVLARVRTQIEAKFARDILTGKNAWLEREVARRLKESRMIGDCSIEALASLAEAHDPDTGLHIRRTQAYVSILTERLSNHPRFRTSLTETKRQLIIRASPLHDIGKVAVPAAILTKPSPLTPAEFEVVQTHTVIGSAAIDRAIAATVRLARLAAPGEETDDSSLDFLRVASEIALSHHEKWDGSGYPRRLAGDAIPVSGRLMALADVFDALTSARVYKPALSRAEIEPILNKGIGTHFDPDVVAVYFDDPDVFHAIAERFADPASQTAALGHDPSLPGLNMFAPR